MSSSSSAGAWLPRRATKHKRGKLRNGTFIIPATGERSRRQFTLRHGDRISPQVDGPDYEEDEDETMPPCLSLEGISERFRASGRYAKEKSVGLHDWLKTPKGRGVLKCTLAYTIASLWTFVRPLADTLGHRDGKHVVATITVYFHPARSAGSMIEATIIAIIAVAYAEIISILSMITSVFFGNVLGWVVVAYIAVLVVFIGAAFGLIGWVKQKLNHPSVNVGCTLAALGIISVVTKENAIYSSVFSNIKIAQMSKLLVFGVATTTSVSLLIWRVSARALLRQSMIKASTSLGDMLAMITHGFLSGSEEELTSTSFTQALSAWSSNYAQMTKNLKESKYEHYFLGHESIYQLEKSVYKSMETLSQSIGALRSAATTQFELLKEQVTEEPLSGPLSPSRAMFSPTFSRQLSAMLKSGQDRSHVLSSIDEAPNETSDEDVGKAQTDAAIPRIFRTPSDIFDLFISLQGPPMKSLAYTLSEVLRAPPFGGAPSYHIIINENFRHSLEEALSLYNTARANALEEIYNKIETGRTSSKKIQADFEEVAAACGHFSFSLQSFGEEMNKYLDVLDDLKHAVEHNQRSWHWLWFWKNRQRHSQILPFDDPEHQPLIRPIRKSQMPRGIPDSMVKSRDTFSWQAAPESNRILQTSAQKLLSFFRFLARDDIRFGIKVGIGATLWAMFAFISQTRDTYMHWRGEWGLLSFMIVCSMTVGASNTTGLNRFVATLIGATCSVINWNISQGAAIPLLLLGCIVAVSSFYIMIERGNAPLGRTILLAYNVSTLYAYALSTKVDDDDDDEGGVHPFIMEIATHRAAAVTAGILWGIIVCRLVWPISARKKFKEGLSVLYLQMGLIWKRGPLAILLRSDCSRSYLKSGEQAALQRYASRLEAWRGSASSEFELRGPFPAESYGRIMAATNRVLDGFYAMSLVTQRRGRLTRGEKALLLFTAEERAQLCERICHVFQVLASSLMLEYPLTNAVPSVWNTRDRLLGKIFKFRNEHATRAAEGKAKDGEGGPSMDSPESVLATEESVIDMPNVVEERDYALVYAYALVTGQVAEQLKVVEKEIEALFGVLNEESLLLQ